jgi:hypothetical protein
MLTKKSIPFVIFGIHFKLHHALELKAKFAVENSGEEENLKTTRRVKNKPAKMGKVGQK